MRLALAIFAWLSLTGYSDALLDDDDLVLNNPDALSNEGTTFVLGFFDNIAVTILPERDLSLHIGTNDPGGAEVTISAPLDSAGFATQTISVAAGETQRVDIPDSFAVTSNTDQDKAIKVESTNNANINVIGVNDERVSSDTFLALPCKDFNSNDGTSLINEYKYFVFSTINQATTATSVQAAFLIMACEPGTTTITYRLPSDTSDRSAFITQQYRSFYFRRGDEDLTGTIITSNQPISVFVGHNCGNIPSSESACDLMVEQIPPSAVYGQLFFALPFALRRSGDIYRIGSVVDNNEITITCTRREGSGPPTFETIAESIVINEGQYYELRTIDALTAQISIDDYRRDFCCIETSQPATVMQYMLGHSADEVAGVPGISGAIGDPAMTYVPPVEQFRNDYVLRTNDDALDDSTFTEFKSYVSWAIPARFFNPSIDSNNVLLNGEALDVPDLNDGSGGYIEIRCSNGEVCGYGAYAPLEIGDSTLSYSAAREANTALYAQVYGFQGEFSYAYPAGYQCEPIGLPRVTVYDVTVREGNSDITVNVKFNRTGGDLSTRTRIFADTVQVDAGGAVDGSDYNGITRRRVVFLPGQVDARMNSADFPFDITIIGDTIPEPTEYLEVHFAIDSGDTQGSGYAYPTAIARVTILDDDTGGATCSLVPDSYTVTEGIDSTVDVTVQTTDPTTQACVLTTSDITAAGGSDYQILTSRIVNFGGSFTTTVPINIINDDNVEATESFRVSLSSTDSDVMIPSGMGTANVDILDVDTLMIGFEPATYSVNEDGGFETLTVVKRGSIDSNIVFTVTTQDGTASSAGNADYTATTQTLTFLPSQSSLTFNVPITDDSIYEENENFQAIISLDDANSPATIFQSTADVTIVNDDNIKYRFNPDAYSVSEGDGVATLTIEQFDRASGIDRDVTLLFSTMDGTATSGSDFTAISGQSVVFGDGVSELMVTVPIIDDNDIESAIESFLGNLVVSSADQSIAQITVPQATVNIDENDEQLITVQFNPVSYSVLEGQIALANIELSEPSTSVVTVLLTTGDDTATAGGIDYVPFSNSLVTFQPGETSFSFPLSTFGDSTDEGSETFTATLSSPNGANLGPDSVATVTIQDPITVRLTPAVRTVGEGSDATLSVVLSSAPQDSAVTVDFTTQDLSAIASSDYTAVTRTLTFQPGGATSQDIVISTIDDNTAELTEMFRAEISNPSPNGMVILLAGQTTSTVTITDNDALTVQFDPATDRRTEGDQSILSVVLSRPSQEEVTVEFTTRDGSATDGSDYTAVTRTLTFAPGVTQMNVPVDTIDDSTAEDDENFEAVLTNPSSILTLGSQNVATVTIEDDETLTVQFDPNTDRRTEGEQSILSVVLSVPSQEEVTVDFTTRDGTATDGSDYTAVTRTLTFAPGVTQMNVPVDTIDDSTAEDEEEFEAVLTNPSGGLTLGPQDVATVTIEDDETLTVQFDPNTDRRTEGEQSILSVVLSVPSEDEVTVEFTTRDGTATDGSDYTAVTRTLTFAPGVTQMNVPVDTIDDSTAEDEEEFEAVLTNPSGRLTLGSQDVATVTIEDDETLTVQFDPNTDRRTEGEQSILSVVLSVPSEDEVTVEFTTRDGTATDGSDYAAVTRTLTFAPGVTQMNVPVDTIDDSTAEGDEDFEAVLTNPSEGTLGPQDVATVTIEDNDILTVQFNPNTDRRTEGEQSILTVVLNVPSDEEVTVDFVTRDVTATDGSDYTAVSRTLTFAPGVTQMNVPVGTIDDSTAEDDEDFEAVLVNPSEGLTLGSNDEATVTIVDNDMLTVQFDPNTDRRTEGEQSILSVVLSVPSQEEVTVDFTTRDGTATDGSDYTAVTRTLTFAPGVTQMNVPVDTIDDSIAEDEEDFEAVLTNPSEGLTLGSQDVATVTIEDDETLVAMFDPVLYPVTEGDVAMLVVVLNNPADKDVTVDITTGDISAEDGSDYTGVDMTITFPAGVTSVTVPVTTTSDDLSELQEMFDATLSNPSDDLTVGADDKATVVIDDNNPLTVSIEDRPYRVPEGDGIIEICAILSSAATEEIVVRVSASESSSVEAEDVQDFLAGDAIITFAAGEVRACENVTIVDDDVMETLEEEFTVSIDGFDPSPLNPMPGPLTMVPVTIIDDDVTSVKLSVDNYMVVESEGSVEVCVERIGDSTENTTVTIIARESSPADATDGADFTSTNVQVTIPASEDEACTNIPILDDPIALEGSEVFVVELIPPEGTPATDPSVSTVTIIDDDVIRVSFDPSTVEEDEDVGSIEVCLMGDRESAESYTVVTMNQPSGDNPATADDDYIVNLADLSVVFPSGGPTTQCIPVRILDDPISLEERETFTFTITSTTDGVVPGDDPEATVAINDDDEPDISVPGVDAPENGSSTEICIEKASLTAQDVTVRVEILDVVGGVDVGQSVFMVVIPGDELSQCIAIELIDNKVALEGNRTYPVRITVIEPAGSGITIPDSTLTITENDMLEVYFKKENYPVSESVGQVETCLLLNCEAAEPVTVTLSAQENIPADAQDGQDFGAAMATVTFQPGETRACASFDIVDDDVVETPAEEDFTVEIVDTTPDVDTTRQPSTTVTITDDDSLSVRIVDRDNTVNEDEETVEICVERIGQSAEDITVTLVSSEQSPASASDDMDFTPAVVSITIPSSDSMACGNLPITDDDTALEPPETFVVELIPPEGVPTSPPESAVVTIIDDDVVGVFFTTPEVSVNEDVPSMATEVCFTANATTATPYVVRLGRRETGDNPATGTVRNETVIGDPLYTVPVLVNGDPDSYSLCFEVHGKSNTTFNFISDTSVSVNAYLVPIGELNVIGAIGVRAEDDAGECRNIKVDLEGCALSTGSGDDLTSANQFSINGIFARRVQSNRVRISVPNGDGLRLVMWVICESTPLNMIRFQISRGVDLAPSCHGLLGQFWSVPVTAESFVAPAGSFLEGEENLFSVQVDPMNGSPVRSFLGDLFPRSWDNTRENCMYVGNGQGGPGGEFDELPDSVIQGRYTDYIVDSMFETDFEYDRIGDTCRT